MDTNSSKTGEMELQQQPQQQPQATASTKQEVSEENEDQNTDRIQIYAEYDAADMIGQESGTQTPIEDKPQNSEETTNDTDDRAVSVSNNGSKSSKAGVVSHENLPKQRNLNEDLFSTKRWGVSPIRQDTPWELPPSPTSSNNNQQPQQSSSSNNATAVAAATRPIGSGMSSVAVAANFNSLNSIATLPPGISQSGDSFRSSGNSSVNDFHTPAAMVNNFNVDNMGGNGLANSLGHMSLGGSAGAGVLHSWRGPAAKQHQPSMASSSSPFANHNLMNPSAPSNMQKSMLANSGSGNGGSFIGMSANEGFARAPGPASSMMDNNMTPKPFGMTNRSSTWSAFGNSAPGESESEWPKSSASGISAGNPTQPSGGLDLVSEFEPGKSWHGSLLMKGLDEDSTNNSDSGFAGAYGVASKSTPGAGQYESSGIGTWSPVVKGNRSGSKWDGDGPDKGGDDGRFDDGTAIWGSPAQTKVVGVDWVDKSGGDTNNANNDKSRSGGAAGNNQAYRGQQSSSSTSLLMSSNTSPSSQHNRSQQAMKQPSIGHNYDQVQQQSNALSGQSNQQLRGSGLSNNVPSTQQLKHMVQQIQLAVQAGHLNPQILNQPLAPVTLQLLYQLLQQIKVLHQLQVQASQQFSKPGSSHPATVNVHITKTKQTILNLQNQIAAQQAVYLKQNQAQNISSRQPTMPNVTTNCVGGGIGPALPPGISQSGDSFRSSGNSSVNDFHTPAAMVNNFNVDNMGGNGLANSLGHMSLGGSTGAGVLHSSRFDQTWRAPAAKQHQPSMASSSSPFANHNLMNPSAPSNMQKSMLANSGSGNGGSFIGMSANEGFARAPGPASSMMDNNMTPKPFGMTNRSSTWSAFGNSAPGESESEWPKSSASGISAGNATQPSNAFDLVPEFEPGKPWRGSMLMKSVEDDPTMTPGNARSISYWSS